MQAGCGQQARAAKPSAGDSIDEVSHAAYVGGSQAKFL